MRRAPAVPIFCLSWLIVALLAQPAFCDVSQPPIHPQINEGTLKGGVSINHVVTPETLSLWIDDLTNRALELNPEMQKLNKAVNSRRTIREAILHKAKDSLNFS